MQHGAYLTAAKLGAGLLLNGHQQRLLEELLLTFDYQQIWNNHEVVIFDSTDERYDAAIAPLLFTMDYVIRITAEQMGAL